MPPRLTPGENLQVQQNLQVQRDLDLHERKERNANLWTSSLKPQPDVGDSDMAAGTESVPTAETIRRTRIVPKRSDPEVPTEGVPKRMRIWSKHSRPLTPAVVSEQPEKRAKIPAPASVNPETLAMMLESDVH